MIRGEKIDSINYTQEDPLTAEMYLDDELKIFDFSHYPLPTKDTKIMRCFYNNVNGLEINAAIEAKVNNTKSRSKNAFLNDIETHTKLEALLKQMYDWNIDMHAFYQSHV